MKFKKKVLFHMKKIKYRYILAIFMRFYLEKQTNSSVVKVK